MRKGSLRIMLPAVVWMTIMITALTGCGKKEESAMEAGFFAGSGKTQFAVTSQDLKDGVWNSAISNTDKGENASPQLSWDPVDGADSYVIYMVDTSASNWVHWKQQTRETTLASGSSSKEEYKGPYPPNGTHTYEVYVIALAAPVEKVKGLFDNADSDIAKKMLDLDTAADGKTGNILGFGRIVGTYTKGK